MVNQEEQIYQSNNTDPSTKTLIGIAIDGSSESEYAVEYALENILNKETNKVVLINVRSLVDIPMLPHDIPIVQMGKLTISS